MQVSDFFKKEALAQVFSCEFFNFAKSSFLTEHVQATASVKFTNLVPH